jgi:hypothetical protein
LTLMLACVRYCFKFANSPGLVGVEHYSHGVTLICSTDTWISRYLYFSPINNKRHEAQNKSLASFGSNPIV